jgi:hypothetical protein
VNGNGPLTATLRQRTIYLAVLVIFFVGAVLGGFIVWTRNTCQQLRAEQQRTVALFAVLAKTSANDGAVQSSAALQAYANQAKSSLPNC